MSTASIALLGVLLCVAGPHPAAPEPPAPPAVTPPTPPAVTMAMHPEAAPTPPRPRSHVVRIHPHADAPRPPRAPMPPRVAWRMSMDDLGPRLGVQVSDMSEPLRDFFGAPKDAGLLVQGVEPGSAAEGAKLRVGDVIVEVDGQRIARVADVRRALADRRKGDAVEVEVIRNKKRKTLEATLTTGEASVVGSFGSDFDFELPSDLHEHLDPATRAQVQRQLEHAREQLRRVERTLEALERAHDDHPAASDDDGKPKSKAKRKRKIKRKPEQKRSKPAD